MVTMLAGIAEFEQSLIKARTDAGIERARAAGVKFGRKPKLNAFQRQEAMRRLGAGEFQSEIARTFGVDQSTISRLAATIAPAG
jgi:DNA invertase Pin-like site-specific DNA recombinase